MTSERKFIEENVKRVLLKEYLRSKTERSGFGGLDIQRTPMGTRVTLIAERPGMVIGRKGETIKELTDYVQNEFNFDNPQIEVKEVTNPNLNPHIMAQKLANALERGWHFRRAGHSTVRRIMSAGAKGCQVIISGKLTGQRHRTEKFREGHIKYCGETKLQWMHQGYAVAKKKLGVIGVKVQIMDPNAKLPDEIEFQELKDIAEIKAEISEDVKQIIEEVSSISIPETESETETDGKLKKDDEQSAEDQIENEEVEEKDTIKESKKKDRGTSKKSAEQKDKKEELTESEENEIEDTSESKEETKVEVESKTTDEAKIETETEAEAEAEPEPEAETEPEAEPEPEAENEAESVPEPEPEPDIKTDTESDPEI